MRTGRVTLTLRRRGSPEFASRGSRSRRLNGRLSGLLCRACQSVTSGGTTIGQSVEPTAPRPRRRVRSVAIPAAAPTAGDIAVTLAGL